MLRSAIGQDARRVVIDGDQVRCDAVCAVSRLQKPRKIIMRDRFLIMFQHIPAGRRTENAEIVGRFDASRRDRHVEREANEASRKSNKMRHEPLDFVGFNTMLAKC